MIIYTLFFLHVFRVVTCQVVCSDDGGSLGATIWRGNCYCPSNNGNAGTGNQETSVLLFTNCFNKKENWCSTLASIHSRNEEDYVRSIIGTNIMWIGLKDNSSSLGCSWDKLEWDDGSPKDYQESVSCPFPGGYGNPKCFLIWSDPDRDWGEYAPCVSTTPRGVCKYKLYCFGLWAGDVDVCSGHGTCYSEDICTCESGYFGEDCSVSDCFGVLSNDSNACNSRGNCTSPNFCVCDSSYMGNNCSVEMTGLCDDPNERFNGYCYKNAGSGRSFDDAEKYCEDLVPTLDSHLVSIHSLEEDEFVNSTFLLNNDLWIGLKKYGDTPILHPCPPPDGFGYYWSDGSNDSYALSKSIDCDSNHVCIGSNIYSGWKDYACSGTSLDTICKFKIPLCNNIYSYDATVCSGVGFCVSTDNCSCNFGKFGDNCEKWKCGVYLKDNYNEVCSGHGTCIATDQCHCDENYVGDNCEVALCSGVRDDDNDVCLGRGECVEPNSCGCDDEYAGSNCEYRRICQQTGIDFEWSGSCYGFLFYPATISYKKSFQSAEIHCSQMWESLPNGHLTSVHSDAELAFFWSHASDFFFIGVYRDASVDTCSDPLDFEFTDGTNSTWFIDPSVPKINCLFTNRPYFYYSGTEFGSTTTSGMTNLVCKRVIPSCYGEKATENSVCSGKGLCVDNDECYCFNPYEYYGDSCNITLCSFIESTDGSVCSSHGTCWPFDTCNCVEDFYGDNCEIISCHGYFSNSSGVCSGHGTCIEKDSCQCDNGYYSHTCNITTCDGIWSNDSSVCNMRGQCLTKDSCECDSNNYFGDNCQKTYCGGIASDSLFPRVCSGKGSCLSYDSCQCDEDYYGDICNITTCNGLYSNSSEVCFNRVGRCFPKDRCFCGGYPYVGEFCSISHPCCSDGEYERNGYCYKNFGDIGNWNESEDACQNWFNGGHLISIEDSSEDDWVWNKVVNNFMFVGAQKNVYSEETLYPCPLSGGYWWSDGSSDSYLVSKGSEVNCSTNGTCLMVTSNGTWHDDTCLNAQSIYEAGCKFEIPVCFGIQGNMNQTVCSSHGYCFLDDNCTCNDDNGHVFTGKYHGPNCNRTFCNSISSTDFDNVCNGHGTCWPLDSCDCQEHYFGQWCEVTICNGIFNNETVCSGNGDCVEYEICYCNENYYGEDCNITKCNSIYSNMSSVCSGRGVCHVFEECQCDDDYFGEDCNVTSCFDIMSNLTTSVCYGNGDCFSKDICQCDDGYYGKNCNVTECFGDLSNTTESCGSHGYCFDLEICDCYDEYFGEQCNVTTCHNEWSNRSEVCYSHGSCTIMDRCDCFENYFGEFCNVTTCHDVFSNDSDSCGDYGWCKDYDHCKCQEHYHGEFCNVSTCHFLLGNMTDVCDGHGRCDAHDDCYCDPYYFGIYCNFSQCYDVLANYTESCGSHGSCMDYNDCDCYDDYFGDICNYTTCFGVWNNESSTSYCFGHGDCYDFDDCECDDNYYGEQCNLTKCNDIMSNVTNICSTHGTCNIFEECQCFDNYYGPDCNITICNDIYSNDTSICSIHGSCTVFEECQCDDDYYGPDCNITICNYEFSNDTVCSNHGVCLIHEKCQCDDDYFGEYCNITKCHSFYSNETEVCSGHGECFDSLCQCDDDYYGLECNITSCGLFFSNETSEVCSGHGDCDLLNICICDNLFSGDDCEFTICYGYWSNDTNYVCTNHGDCGPEPNECHCDDNYFGDTCTTTTCNNVFNNETVCSSHGDCTLFEICQCDDNYFGEDCNITSCNNIFNNISEVCSNGNGTCTLFDRCDCNIGYFGEDCEVKSCDGVLSNTTEACNGFGNCVMLDECVCFDSVSTYINGSLCDNLIVPSPPLMLSEYAVEIEENVFAIEYCEDIKFLSLSDPRIYFLWNSSDVETQNEINSFVSAHGQRCMNITTSKPVGRMNITIYPVFNETHANIQGKPFRFSFYRKDILESIDIDGPAEQYTFYNSPTYELTVTSILSSQCRDYILPFPVLREVRWKQISGKPINTSALATEGFNVENNFFNQTALELGRIGAFTFYYNETEGNLFQRFKFVVEVNSTFLSFFQEEVEVILQTRPLSSVLNESSQSILVNRRKSIRLSYYDLERSNFPESITWICMFNYTNLTCDSAGASVITSSPSSGESDFSFLPISEGVYEISSIYSKDGRNISQSIDMNVVDPGPNYFPDIYITPIPERIDTSESLVIIGHIAPSEHINTVQFEWSCPSLGSLLPEVNLLSTTNSSLTLIVKPDIIISEYTTFILTARTTLGVVVSSSVTVVKNYPPSSGSLLSFPSVGQVQSTLFEIRFSNWVDTENPLMYRLSYYNIFTHQVVLLTDWSLNNVVRLMFPIQGCRGDDFAINIIGDIKDYYGAQALISSNVTVMPADYDTVLGFVVFVTTSLSDVSDQMNQFTIDYDEGSGDENQLLVDMQKKIKEGFELVLKAVYYAVKKDCVLIVSENSFCISLEECEAIDIPFTHPEVITDFGIQIINLYDRIMNISSSFKKTNNLKINSLVDSNLVDSFFEILKGLDISNNFELANITTKFLNDYLPNILYIDDGFSELNNLISFSHLNTLINIPKKIIQTFKVENLTMDQIDSNFDIVLEILKFTSKKMSVTMNLDSYFDSNYLPSPIQSTESIFNVQFKIIKEYSADFIVNEMFFISEKIVSLESSNQNYSDADIDVDVQINENLGKEYIINNEQLSVIVLSHTPTKISVYILKGNEVIDPSTTSFSFDPIRTITFRNVKSNSRRRSSLVYRYRCFEGKEGVDQQECTSSTSIFNDVIQCQCSRYNTQFELLGSWENVEDDDDTENVDYLLVIIVTSALGGSLMLLLGLVGLVVFLSCFLPILLMFSIFFCIVFLICVPYSRKVSKEIRTKMQQKKRSNRIQSFNSEMDSVQLQDTVERQKEILKDFIQTQNIDQQIKGGLKKTKIERMKARKRTESRKKLITPMEVLERIRKENEMVGELRSLTGISNEEFRNYDDDDSDQGSTTSDTSITSSNGENFSPYSDSSRDSSPHTGVRKKNSDSRLSDISNEGFDGNRTPFDETLFTEIDYSKQEISTCNKLED